MIRKLKTISGIVASSFFTLAMSVAVAGEGQSHGKHHKKGPQHKKHHATVNCGMSCIKKMFKIPKFYNNMVYLQNKSLKRQFTITDQSINLLRGQMQSFQSNFNTYSKTVNKRFQTVDNRVGRISHFAKKNRRLIRQNMTNISNNAVRIGTNAANIQDNSDAIVGNMVGIAKNSVQINQNASAIAGDQANIATNTGRINTNQTNIANNASDIMSNQVQIWNNDVDIAQNASAIASNQSQIWANESAIQNNASDIAWNQEQIWDNDDAIAQNASNIATNTSNIATNASDIATNASDIAWNSEDIAINSLRIDQNQDNIADNAANIATDQRNIRTNRGNIATNAKNIVKLSDIQVIDTEVLKRLNRELAVTINAQGDNNPLFESNMRLPSALSDSTPALMSSLSQLATLSKARVVSGDTMTQARKKVQLLDSKLGKTAELARKAGYQHLASHLAKMRSLTQEALMHTHYARQMLGENPRKKLTGLRQQHGALLKQRAQLVAKQSRLARVQEAAMTKQAVLGQLERQELATPVGPRGSLQYDGYRKAYSRVIDEHYGLGN